MTFDKSIINDDYPSNYIYDLNLSNYDTKIIGIDEAGRGALAGPVVVAGVIPDYSDPLLGVTDSKKLSEKKRELFYSEITSRQNYKYHISIIDHKTIDEINILNATKQGMAECLDKLYEYYMFAITDAVKLPLEGRTLFPIVKADLKSASTACASILAKVTRDRIITKLGETYPDYGFDKNKGYPTKYHLDALKRVGVSPIHRKSYAPVKAILNSDNQHELL